MNVELGCSGSLGLEPGALIKPASLEVEAAEQLDLALISTIRLVLHNCKLEEMFVPRFHAIADYLEVESNLPASSIGRKAPRPMPLAELRTRQEYRPSEQQIKARCV